MNRITSPIAFLAAEPPPSPLNLEPEDSLAISSNWTALVDCSPFQNIDLESTVLSQVQKAFTCFNRILNACCVDCSIEDKPENEDLSPSSAEAAVESRIVI